MYIYHAVYAVIKKHTYVQDQSLVHYRTRLAPQLSMSLQLPFQNELPMVDFHVL